MVVDFDDFTDQVECVKCKHWSHLSCKFATSAPAEPAVEVEDKDAAVERDYEANAAPPICKACEDPSAFEPTAWYRFTSSSDDPPGTFDPIAPLLRRAMSAAGDNATSGGADTRLIRISRLRGLHVRTGKFRDEKIADEVITRGIYERPKFDFEIVPGDTWCDLGAHVGVFTSLCLAAGCDVVSVEPDRGNFEVLERNASLNAGHQGQQTCLVHAACLPSCSIPSKATVTLYLHPEIGFRHSVIAKRRRIPWAEVSVPATSLPELLRQHPRITAVKVDVQGSEVGIIQSVKVCSQASTYTWTIIRLEP